MSTLTDRYVGSVARRLPESQRDEVVAEVRAMIADMLEARAEATAPEAVDPDPEAADLDHSRSPGLPHPDPTAEAAVLEELGSPESLAREFARTPQHLIGPRFYRTYLWALTWLLPTVGVITLVASGLAHSLTVHPVELGGLLGTAIGRTVSALLTVFAVLTLVFALVDRAESGTAPGRSPRRWTVDQLEEIAPSGSSVRGDGIVSLILLVLLAALPLVPTTFLYVGHLNDGEPFVNPDLGVGWFVGYWALLAGLAAIAAVHVATNRTTAATRIATIGVDILMAAFLTVALLTQEVMHPDLGNASLLDTEVWLIPLIWVLTAWNIVSTLRTHRAAATAGD